MTTRVTTWFWAWQDARFCAAIRMERVSVNQRVAEFTAV